MKNFSSLLKCRLHVFLIRTVSIFYFLLFTFYFSDASIHRPHPEFPLEGRWDLTLSRDGKTFPSWLEVRHSGVRTLVGQFVSTGGSARPISIINFTNGKVSFSIPAQWDTVSNDMNLDGWHASGKNQWKVDSGMLRNPWSESNIMTDQVFNDFKLHIEFRIPANSNSGIYLRGRYEVQILDSKENEEPWIGGLGAIYGFIVPTEQAAKGPGQWQTFDVTLVGRLVTLVLNGKTVICNQEIPGITGGALDSQEGEPGPVMIQGDHGAVDFRNIFITPAL